MEKRQNVRAYRPPFQNSAASRKQYVRILSPISRRRESDENHNAFLLLYYGHHTCSVTNTINNRHPCSSIYLFIFFSSFGALARILSQEKHPYKVSKAVKGDLEKKEKMQKKYYARRNKQKPTETSPKRKRRLLFPALLGSFFFFLPLTLYRVCLKKRKKERKERKTRRRNDTKSHRQNSNKTILICHPLSWARPWPFMEAVQPRRPQEIWLRFEDFPRSCLDGKLIHLFVYRMTSISSTLRRGAVAMQYDRLHCVIAFPVKLALWPSG